MPNDHIRFDFLGKDSIRYENEVVVHPKVYQLVKKFCHQFDNKKRKRLHRPICAFNSLQHCRNCTVAVHDSQHGGVFSIMQRILTCF